MINDATTSAIVAHGVSKRFSSTLALSNVDFELRVGEVHGLVGSNGAGKSTLVKIIMGADTPDEGTVDIPGVSADGHGGIAAIFQELTIIPEMSVLSNVFLGSQTHRGPFLWRRKMRRAYDRIALELGCAIDPNARAGSLSVANQQLVEIMRVLAARHGALIMDEPTAALGASERDHLYTIVHKLKSQGTAIVYISHDLDEVLHLCDRISVMRDGRLIATEPTGAWTKDRIVEAMLGMVLPKRITPTEETMARAILTVERLKPAGARGDVSFSLGHGEILGIAGLVGSGRTEILRALAGADTGASGHIIIDGRRVAPPRTVRQALALGIALVPEDRKAQGFVALLNGYRNMTLTDLGAISTLGFSSKRRRIAASRRIAQSLGLALDRLPVPTGNLSGGNQQKIVIGKWFHRRPKILLLDEPTRGIDIGAKAEVYSTIRGLTQSGMSAIVVSSELEEIVDNCDRILVIARGRLIGEIAGRGAATERILEMIFVGGTAAAGTHP